MKKIIIATITFMLSLGAYASNEGSSSKSNSSITEVIVTIPVETIQGRISDKKTEDGDEKLSCAAAPAAYAEALDFLNEGTLV